MGQAITAGQWNRTLLHRQHLLSRVDEDAVEVIDRCVGLQSQDPQAAHVALAARIDGFAAGELDDLLTSREVVRMVLLRGTIFLIDAEDARWLRPLAGPTLDAAIASNHRRALHAASTGDVVDAARELLCGVELSVAALGSALAERFPGESSSTLTAIARCGLPLVQVPPRGLWGGRGAPTYQLFDDWAGPGEPAVTGDDARRDLIRLYLRGHGPATVKGISTWAGVRGLRPLVEAMEADWELAALTGPDGEVLYDLEGLDIVDADEPAPVRLIAPYDHILVSSADRRRIAADDHYRLTVTANGRSPGFVLVDGRLAGTWSMGGDPDQPRVRTEMFVEPPKRARPQLDDEVARLETFYRTGAT